MKGAARDLLRAMRPAQWTKNAVVFAPVLFAMGDQGQQLPPTAFGAAAGAAILFCLASSAVYLVNDVHDREQDRVHPVKKNRPIAAGRLSPRVALTAAGGLAGAALIGGILLSPAFALALTTYLVLQTGYTFLLKEFALVDAVLIAVGFVLRAVAGAGAIHAAISPWLLVCTFGLALFLALCKRRQELVRSRDPEMPRSRTSLARYDRHRLDRAIALTASATLACYAMYTVSPDTVAKFGDTRLWMTIPFVLAGLGRYLHLVYRRDLGERPERILLTDAPTLIIVASYGGVVARLLLF